MKLVGMFDSPFVRPIAITLKMFGVQFEHLDWSIGKDFDKIIKYNPLGRVPTLVLDNDEILIEALAIIDYLNETFSNGKPLLPKTGEKRRNALHLIALATGAAEKGREQIYELSFRPPEKRHTPWTERCKKQMFGALNELESLTKQIDKNTWFLGETISQADIMAACSFTFLTDAMSEVFKDVTYPNLTKLTEKCENREEFKSTKIPFFQPNG